MVRFCPICNNLLRKKVINSKLIFKCNCGYSELYAEDLKDKELNSNTKIKKET